LGLRSTLRNIGGFAVNDSLSAAGRVFLAVLLGSAGAIHLAMVPSHMDSSSAEGIGFALVGWFQIGLALWLLARPSRNALRLAMLTNVAFLGVWAISRSWGLPVGEHAGHPHDVAFVDLACVGIEVAVVVTAALLLEHPSWGRTWHGARLAVAAIIPVSVLALATAALASPSARNHAHSSHGGHVHTDAVLASADGHVHGHGTASGGVAPADDLGLSKLENGHQHAFGEVKLDHATQAALSQQLNETSKLIAKYPTIAAAEAAGYRRAGPFSPGLGTHYIGLGNRNMDDDVIQGTDGPMYPALIYDGTTSDSPLAGFMFTSFKGPDGAEPGGFVGPNDHWHFHTRVCLVNRNGAVEAPFGADRTDVTLLDCLRVHGHMTAVTTYMVHVWTVPGYESSKGVFSEVNPKITCPDGSYYMVKDVAWRINACKSAPA
jgi:hypothetical protein